MKNFNKNLNIAFLGGIFGMALMTWISPRLIALTFTPPVSFGVNCEPVGKWSMEKLIICQIVGLFVGIVFTFWLKSKVLSPKNSETIVKNN